MPDRCVPCTTAAPMSTLTLRFFTPASDPEITWLQPVPSREILVSCATASGASRASTKSSPTNCGERFKINHLNFYLSSRTSAARKLRNSKPGTRSTVCHSEPGAKPGEEPAFISPSISINLRQLRQHRPRLRLDVLALILGRQRHQHSAHAAIRFHRLPP